MGKTRGVHETTPELRNRMVGMYEAGLGLREIAQAVNCSQRTVKRWLNRFDKEGTVETRDRCGRKRATTVEQDKAIVRLATQTPITAAKAVLPALGLTCSVDTVRERLHKAGIHNWSPSRKHMQRIPLGTEGDVAAIQQAVWRPTGTQLGKKKSGTEGKPKRSSGNSSKRKFRPRFKYVGDGAPSEAPVAKQQQVPAPQPEYQFPQNIQQPQCSESSDLQGHLQPLAPAVSQSQFSAAALSLPQQPQAIYQHPGMNVATVGQTWPLDLVQGSHHYQQNPANAIAHEPPPPQQQQLQELHTQQEQHQIQQEQHQHGHQQHQIPQNHLPAEQNAPSHHHPLQHEQHEQLQMENQMQQLPQNDLPSPQMENNCSDSCYNSSSSNENSQNSDVDMELSKDGSQERNRKTQKHKKKKKGGKAKGTLETSVEIRNRMIGMSEAGLSTLSIALALNRSERTVKRWLERWRKEGNVKTKERKGRRRITTKEQDDAIIAMATQHPLTAAKYVAPALGLKCSVDTIRERLHKAGIHSWKLGKKQGEGNAVHTVHLWQPSGNRLNKPKQQGEKKRKSSSSKKRDTLSEGTSKRTSRRKKVEETSLKVVPPPANMIPEQTPAIQYHNSPPLTNYVPAANILQPVHNLPGPPPTLSQQQQQPPPPPPTVQQSPGSQPMQPMGPIMQQRPDCRLAPSVVPPVPNQGNSNVNYPSCMVGSSNHTHLEQPDPLNYEPYIWSF